MLNFEGMVIGHLVGDYLLQTKKMAIQKSSPGINGLIWCIWHSLIYTACVCLCTWHFSPVFAGLVFLTHFPIDRWSLGEYWLKMLGGRDFKQEYATRSDYWEIHLPFACIVYTVVDNTLHLLLMWLLIHHI